jgi:hypothetical protein
MRNITCSIALALVVNSSMVLFKILVLEERPLSSTAVVEELLCTMSAIAGIAINTSLGGVLLYDLWVSKSGMVRMFVRKLMKKMLPTEHAKLVLCDRIEDEAPGHCAICLEALRVMPPEEARARSSRRDRHGGNGILRLPCGHAFHCVCAEPWLEREDTCPMCRRSCGRKRGWVRICERTPQSTGGSRSSEESESGRAAQPTAQSDVIHEV